MSTGQGMGDSVRHMVYMIIISVLINTVLTLFLKNSGYEIYFSIISALFSVLLIFTLTKMGYAYIIGWILGIILLIYGGILGTGLITAVELIIDIAIPIVAIVLKLFILPRNEYD